MSDVDHEDEFDKAFEGFGEDKPTTPVVVDDPKKDEEVTPKADEKPKEEPKKDDQPSLEDPKKEETTPPANTEEKPKEGTEPDKTTEAPVTPEEPKPLTKDDVTSIINNIRMEERDASKELQDTTQEVLSAFYPDGLSNVLIDQGTGRELRTPQDVVDVSGGEMSIEQATQWLMNEQYRLDTDIAKIKNDAEKIAETTINFKRDSIAAVQKYEPLFKWQPSLQRKVFDRLMESVKADEKKGVILQAPDVLSHYDFYLEPYQKAFEFSQGKPATNPVPSTTEPEAPVTPSADDRMDENGDGGQSPVDDPNDFAQQVNKELAKGM